MDLGQLCIYFLQVVGVFLVNFEVHQVDYVFMDWGQVVGRKDGVCYI